MVTLRWAQVTGDLASVRGLDTQPVRVEHWGAALSQGRAAARTALADLGLVEPQDVVPGELPSYSTNVHGTNVHGTNLTILGWPPRSKGELPLLGALDVAGDALDSWSSALRGGLAAMRSRTQDLHESVTTLGL